MDFKRRTILLVCLLTFVEIWNIISADISFKKYNSDPSLAGRRCGPTDTVFKVDNVFDHLQCGWLCHFDNMCGSFFYQPDLYQCIGCRVNVETPACNETYTGSKYFGSKLTHNTDCKHIIENQIDARSGLYELSLWKSKEKLTVFCDMDTDGGGWTVFQNRFDGSVNFTRNFYEYDSGFGNISGEFWLGLKNIQELASQCSTDIRLEMTRHSGEKWFQRYTDFRLLDGRDYKISFEEGPADGTSGLKAYFNLINGQRFSTFDRDMHGRPLDDYCVKQYGGGWWYDNCEAASLNNDYCTPGTRGTRCIAFRGIGGYESLKGSRISIRRA